MAGCFLCPIAPSSWSRSPEVSGSALANYCTSCCCSVIRDAMSHPEVATSDGLPRPIRGFDATDTRAWHPPISVRAWYDRLTSSNPNSHALAHHHARHHTDRNRNMAAPSTPTRRPALLACAATLATLGLQTASAFLVAPPPSASSPASLELARRPFVGYVRLPGRVDGWILGGGAD